MNEPSSPKSHTDYFNLVADIIIRLGVLALIIGWCFQVLRPFFNLALWGMIIAITLYPVFNTIKTRLKGRRILAAVFLTVVCLSLIVLPAWLLADSLWEGIEKLRAVYQEGTLTIPPPGPEVKDWPPITKPVVDLWESASRNLTDVAVKYAPQIQELGKGLLTLIAGTGIGLVQFILSIIIAGVFLCFAEVGGGMLRKVFIKLAGEDGNHFAELSEKTIRNVVKGILGVALVQAILASIGFVVAGVPLAGLWTLLCLILAIVQVGIGPVVLCVVIYMYATADTLTASLLMVWLILVTLVDNFLKPILLGRGASVPLLVVFLGAIGGFIATGFMGLFLGAVILSLGYKLFQSWLEESAKAPLSEKEG